jgi:hypothetical protein
LAVVRTEIENVVVMDAFFAVSLRALVEGSPIFRVGLDVRDLSSRILVGGSGHAHG